MTSSSSKPKRYTVRECAAGGFAVVDPFGRDTGVVFPAANDYQKALDYCATLMAGEHVWPKRIDAYQLQEAGLTSAQSEAIIDWLDKTYDELGHPADEPGLLSMLMKTKESHGD